MTMTATRSVLHFAHAVRASSGHVTTDEQGATFLSTDDDTGVERRRVVLPHNDWEELGKPDHITITIEPGDRLNTPGA